MPDEIEERRKVEETARRQKDEIMRDGQIVMARKAEQLMNYLQIVVVYILVLLFGIAVYDLGLKLFNFTLTGQIFQPVNVIAILETALLLFLVVEVFRTSVAHVEGLKVLPLVIDVAIIGVVRSLITYRFDAFETMNSALMASISYALILAVLIAAFYIVHRQERKKPKSHR